MFTVYAHVDEGYGWHVAKTERGTTLLRRGGGRDDFESELRWYVDEDVTVIFTVNNDLNFRRVVAPAIERTIWRGSCLLNHAAPDGVMRRAHRHASCEHNTFSKREVRFHV